MKMKVNRIIAVFAVLFAFLACKPTEKIEYVDKEKIVYQNAIKHDSIFNDVHDSIFQTIYQKGDTIFSVKYKEKIKEVLRYNYVKDTIFTDSIQYKIKKEVTTKKIIPKWCYCSLVVWVLLLIFAISKIYKWLH